MASGVAVVRDGEQLVEEQVVVVVVVVVLLRRKESRKRLAECPKCWLVGVPLELRRLLVVALRQQQAEEGYQ